MKTLHLYEGYKLDNPAFIVGYYNQKGEAAAAFATLIQQSKENPNILILKIANAPSYSSLFTARQVSIAFATTETEKACRILCTASNADNPVHLLQSGLTIEHNDEMDAPNFAEFPLTFYCSVLPFQVPMGLKIKLESSWADSELFNSNNTVNCLKINFIDSHRVRDEQIDLDGQSRLSKLSKQERQHRLKELYARQQERQEQQKRQQERQERQKRLERIRQILTLALSKYQCNDCYITEGLPDHAIYGCKLHYDIDTDKETILMIRDTSFMSNENQGTVLTDKGIHHINNNNKKYDIKFIAWGSIRSMKYDDKEKSIHFRGKNNQLLDTIHLYDFIKKEAQQEIARELITVFSSINDLFTTQEAEHAATCWTIKRRSKLFYHNFYTPFGNPDNTPFMQFFKIEGGAMIVSRVLSDKVNGLWRVMYIEETDNYSHPTIYAKVPNLSMIRYVFKYAKSEDNYFNTAEFPTLLQAVSNTFWDSGLRTTKKDVEGRKQHMLAMELPMNYYDVCKNRLTRELKQQILKFAHECEKVTQEMNRFMMHPRFKLNLTMVKQGHTPYGAYMIAGVLAYKIVKLCCAYDCGSDGDDRGVEEALGSLAGVDADAISNFDSSNLGNLDLASLGNLDTAAIGNEVDFGGLISLDCPLADYSGTDFSPADYSAGGSNASDGYLVNFQTQQPYFDVQADGSVLSTDMFGMPHQWTDMDAALYNTDVMSGLPFETWTSSSASATAGSVSFGGSDYTPHHSEPDISFYNEQFDDASDKFLEYSEKLRWDEEHGHTENLDFYRSQMNEAYHSMDYWERTGNMEYYNQKMDCIKTDAILNAADRASADLHATLEAMDRRFRR